MVLHVGFLAGALTAQEPREIVLRSAVLDQRDLEVRKNYTYIIHTEQRRLDSKGGVTRTQSEDREVLILYGSPYRRLIARDGRPLSAEEERKEQKKLDKELERRKKAAQKDPGKLAREQERALEEQRALVREVADAFTFRIAGEEPAGGRDAWIIEAEPIPGYRPRTDRAKLLPSFRGRLWITKDDYRWVKVEAETIRTVSFGWILARLQPGSHLAFEQRPVEEDLWMPTSASIRIFARVALLRKLNAAVDIRFSNYRKFQSDSRILETRELNPGQQPEP